MENYTYKPKEENIEQVHSDDEEEGLKRRLYFENKVFYCTKCFEGFKYPQFVQHEAKCGKRASLNTPFDDMENQEEYTPKPFDEYYASKSNSPEKSMGITKFETASKQLGTPLMDHNHATRADQPSQATENNQRDCLWYFSVSIIGFVTLTIMWVVGFLGIKWIFFDSNLTFKWICIGNNLYEENHDLCFFSLGQFSIGIIAVGQLGVGFITIAQGGISLLFGVGQGLLGCGVTIGQFTVSCYAYAAMVGVAFYRVKHVLVGLHSLYSLKTLKSFEKLYGEK